MKGPRPTGDVPIGVNAAVGKDTRKGLAAMVDIEDGKIASVAFTPTFADEESRHAFLKADDPIFGEIADEIDTFNKEGGLSASFTRKNHRVTKSGQTMCRERRWSEMLNTGSPALIK